MEITAESLDSALVMTGGLLLDEGIPRKTRGFDCIELPEPIKVTITDPSQRYITNPVRKWNKYLGAAESLWLLNGVNGMDFVGKVVKNLYSFSDDGQTMRAGYGPRIRAFSGIANDYKIHDPSRRNIIGGHCHTTTVDQLRYVVELLKVDINTRQASMTIHDPVKDCFDPFGGIKQTKDQPCTRLIQFMMVDGVLDCTVYMRSNDFLWGFSAVNIYNFTTLQEVVAGLVGVPVGKYHHIANNLHYYDNFKSKVKDIVDGDYSESDRFNYNFNGISLSRFDEALKSAYSDANRLADNSNPYFTPMLTGVDMIDDMLKLISRKFQGIQDFNSDFKNPIITKLFNE